LLAHEDQVVLLEKNVRVTSTAHIEACKQHVEEIERAEAEAKKELEVDWLFFSSFICQHDLEFRITVPIS
jgi:hypothetical protein